MKKTAIITIQRYPKASDPTLRAWNSADELLIQKCLENDPAVIENCIIFHDLFGYLSCALNRYQPQSVITYASQEFALKKNVSENHLSLVKTVYLLEKLKKSQMAVLKIPKSIDLFRLYLVQLVRYLDKGAVVYCGFMTRNFTEAWIRLAEEFFSDITQTKASKKARVLVLKSPIMKSDSLIREFADEKGEKWKQYLGVFSSGRIDYGSQFLMDNLHIPIGHITALDVGSGNGVLGKFIHAVNPEAEVHLTDDFLLAARSAEMNLSGDLFHHHFSRNLDFMLDESCDLVVTNPPFHLEYEINMDVAIQIFKDAERVLKKNGRFWVVANNNLPYKPELLKYFQEVKVVEQNRRFIVYCCKKGDTIPTKHQLS